MTTYVTAGGWGAGTGTPNSAAQVDTNFYEIVLRLNALEAPGAGKLISSTSFTTNSVTFTYTNATSDVVPLPVADLQLVGEWTNNTLYQRANMVNVRGLGVFRVLEDHTSALTGPFDPNATDGSTDETALYQLWLPTGDINYDVAPFIPGDLQRAAGDILFQFKAPRPMTLVAGDDGAFAYIDTALEGSTDADDIILGLYKNGAEVGTITFTPDGDTDGGQDGALNIPDDVALTAGDLFGIAVIQSDNIGPKDLSITLPFIRTDI